MKPPVYRVQNKKVEETDTDPWKDIGKDYPTLQQAKDCKEWLESAVKSYIYRVVTVTEVITEV